MTLALKFHKITSLLFRKFESSPNAEKVPFDTSTQNHNYVDYTI